MRRSLGVLVVGGLLAAAAGPACSSDTTSAGTNPRTPDASTEGGPDATGGRAASGSGGAPASGGRTGTGGEGTAGAGDGGAGDGGTGPGGADAGTDASAADGGVESGAPDAEVPFDAGSCDVTFGDAVLEARVRTALGLPAGPPKVTCTQIRRLTQLDVSNSPGLIGPPASLAGLEHAINLTVLRADYTTVTNVTPVAKLPKLSQLTLRDSSVTNLTPLKNNPTLKFLEISGYQYRNGFSDLTQLGDMPKLQTLWIGKTSVTSFTHLAVLADTLTNLDVGNLPTPPTLSFIASTLPNLVSLQVYESQIVDLTPLQGMTKLASLRLNNNKITTLLPLVNNTGLSTGDSLDVQVNCLDLSTGTTTAAQQIATLTGRGVSVLSGTQRPAAQCQ